MRNKGRVMPGVRFGEAVAIFVERTRASIRWGGWTLLFLALAPVSPALAADGPRVVATFTVLEDIVRQVVGEYGTVVTLTPVGAEVHEWELTPRNFMALERADLVLYNGYVLEQWMPQVRNAVGAGVPVVPVAERSGYSTRPIVAGDFEGAADPHLWMDAQAVKEYVLVIREVLEEVNPGAADAYRRQAAAYKAHLDALHQEITGIMAEIPPERRLLVTSEAAFVYFAAAYDFRHDAIWGSNAEQEGTPRQLMRVVDLVNQWRPPAIFWESTISDRYVRSVAAETGARVAGPLYVDSLSDPAGEAADYISMMRFNARKLVAELGE